MLTFLESEPSIIDRDQNPGYKDTLSSPIKIHTTLLIFSTLYKHMYSQHYNIQEIILFFLVG